MSISQKINILGIGECFEELKITWTVPVNCVPSVDMVVPIWQFFRQWGSKMNPLKLEGYKFQVKLESSNTWYQRELTQVNIYLDLAP